MERVSMFDCDLSPSAEGHGAYHIPYLHFSMTPRIFLCAGLLLIALGLIHLSQGCKRKCTRDEVTRHEARGACHHPPIRSHKTGGTCHDLPIRSHEARGACHDPPIRSHEARGACYDLPRKHEALGACHNLPRKHEAGGACSSSTPRRDEDWTPCDNYGHLDPTIHSFHKTLYQKCARWCKLRDRLALNLPLS